MTAITTNIAMPPPKTDATSMVELPVFNVQTFFLQTNESAHSPSSVHFSKHWDVIRSHVYGKQVEFDEQVFDVQ
jgi:hypothetical protein